MPRGVRALLREAGEHHRRRARLRHHERHVPPSCAVVPRACPWVDLRDRACAAALALARPVLSEARVAFWLGRRSVVGAPADLHAAVRRPLLFGRQRRDGAVIGLAAAYLKRLVGRSGGCARDEKI